MARFLILWVCGVSQTVMAASEPYESGSGVILQTLAGLICVIVLIFLLAFLARRLNLAQLGQGHGMRILTSLNVSAREKVVLIEVGGEQILIGVAPGRVNTLKAFDGQVVSLPTNNPLTEKLSAKSASEFSKKLNEFLKSGSKTP